MLDPRRLVRWAYISRFSLASAIFLAAVFVWDRAVRDDTRIASLAFAATMVFTVASAMYSEVQRRPLGRTFFMLQSLFDLGLVTAAVHVTGGAASQFAALYILVIAAAAVVLPVGGGLLVALLGCVLYFADALLGLSGDPSGVLWMQLGVFGVVAIGSASISARIQEAGEGTKAELVRVRLRAADILRNIHSGILTVDGAGSLLYANPAAAGILGLDLESRVGNPVMALIAGRTPDLARALESALNGGVRMNRAEGTVERDGRVFPVGVTTTFTSEGGPEGLVSATAIFQDISDQKQLEQLHLRAERLEGVAALSASLAHEIKNPLASIRSAVEQLGAMAGDDSDSRSLSGLVVRESDRLSRLLSEFLDFARVRVTQIAPVDLTAIACGAANLAAAHPDRAEGVTVTCNAPTEPLVVDGDEDLLHRAVFNLTLNAVQATSAGGTVLVTVGPAPTSLPASLRHPGGTVRIVVADNGPGISAEVRSRLFDPFTTTKPGGSGLGLSIVQRAIEAHRGAVLVDSGVTGTRFTIYLPLRQQPQEKVA